MKSRSKRTYGWLLMASMLLPILAACGAPANSGTGASSTPAEAASAPAKSAAASEAAPVGRGSAVGGRRVRSCRLGSSCPPPRATFQNRRSAARCCGCIGPLPRYSRSAEELVHQRDRHPVAGLRGPDQARQRAQDGPGRRRVLGVQRRRDADHLQPARGSDVQRRLAADGRELPLRDRAQLRSERCRRVPVRRRSRSSAAPSSPRRAITDTAAVRRRPQYEAARRRRPGDRRPHAGARPSTAPAPYYATVACIWPFYPAKQELIEAGGARLVEGPGQPHRQRPLPDRRRSKRTS